MIPISSQIRTCHTICLTTLISASVLCVSFAFADVPDTTDSLREACAQNIQQVRSAIATATSIRTGLIIVGAAVAAVSSLLAGIATSEKLRKYGSAIGALAGICTAASQALPDGKLDQTRLVAMDQQKTLGDKVYAQLDLISDNISRLEYTKFIRARFTDCRAEMPQSPPDLPAVAKVSASLETNDGPRPLREGVQARVIGDLTAASASAACLDMCKDAQFEQGEASCHKGLEAAKRFNDRRMEGELLHNLGLCAKKRGILGAAIQRFEESLSVRPENNVTQAQLKDVKEAYCGMKR